MDAYIANKKSVPVGVNQEVSWSLNSDDVVVIGITDNASTAGVGMETWSLSHLDYPLVYGIEEFEINELNASGRIVSQRDGFVRTSSLVDVHNRVRKILFVVMSDSQTDIAIGGVHFRIPVLNRFNDNPPAGQGPAVLPFDQGVNNLLETILTRNQSLKVSFDEYTANYFKGGLN